MSDELRGDGSGVVASILVKSIGLAAAFSLAFAALDYDGAVVLDAARFWKLGYPRTASFYLDGVARQGLSRLLWLLPIAVAGTLVSHFLVTLRRRALKSDLALTPVFLGLLVVLGYRINKSDWFPDFSSLKGALLNAVMIVGSAGFFLLLVRARKSWARVLVAVSLVPMLAGAADYAIGTPTPTFRDVGREVGLTRIGNTLGLAWQDVDGDGWLDLLISGHLGSTGVLYRNEMGRHFSEALAMPEGDFHGPAWGDFNNDGSPDLFVAGGNNTPEGPEFPNLLFENRSSKLREVAEAAGVADRAGRAYGGSWADVDNDGWLDLFVVNYFTPNRLFHNLRDGRFVDVGVDAGLVVRDSAKRPREGTRCSSWSDYDGDGDLDLVTTSLERGVNLYRNRGGGTFVDVTSLAGLSVGRRPLGSETDPRGLTGCGWGDYDNDGHPDLYVAAFGTGLLYRNRGDGTFEERAAKAGVAHNSQGNAVVWGDFDNDGRLDLYLINGAFEGREGDPYGWNVLYRNRGDGTFVDVTDGAGVPGYPFVREASAAVADFDNDGWLDIVLASQRQLQPDGTEDAGPFTRKVLFRNGGRGNAWLELQISGTTSSRDGIGAKVVAVAGGRRQFREQNGGFHLFAQNSPILHFGLGNVSVVESLLVTWPSGRHTLLTSIPARQLLRIREPEGVAR